MGFISRWLLSGLTGNTFHDVFMTLTKTKIYQTSRKDLQGSLSTRIGILKLWNQITLGSSYDFLSE